MKKLSFCHSIAIIMLFVSISSCGSKFEDCHESLYLINKSQTSIYYATTLKDGFLNYDPSNPMYAVDYKVAAGETQRVRIGIQLSCWEQVMDNADGYVYIYIFDAETLESEGWTNTKNNPIKKYTLTAKQLNKMGWNVSYP